MALYAADMRQLAVDQVDAGQQLVAEHRVGGVRGVCERCGGEFPCGPHRRGLELVERYTSWLAAPPAVTAPPFGRNGRSR